MPLHAIVLLAKCHHTDTDCAHQHLFGQPAAAPDTALPTGQNGWKVEASRARGAGGGPRGGGGGGGGYGDRGGDRGGRYGDRGGDRGGGGFDRARSREMRCYECNEVGHLARDCRDKGGGGGGGGRGRSPPRRERERYDSPRRDRSYSADRSVSRSPARGRN
eukprot:jgi/Chrzof1/4412/Cz14g12060.t1